MSTRTRPRPTLRSHRDVGSPFAVLAATRYASLRTYRRDGRVVDLPIWFAYDGDRLWFRSKADAPKLRRIAADARVELRPADWRGRVRADAAVVTGQAHVLDDGFAAAAVAEQALERRYGWQWTVMPLIRIPGTNAAKIELSRRDRLRWMRDPRLWTGFSYVEVNPA